MNDSFYSAFTERFRGSREVVRGKLGIYLPFLEPFLARGESASVLDLGCGRGEWLEMLQEAGCDALGVDLNEEVLTTCRELHLSVEKSDVLSALQNRENESLAVVSAFHLVEHLSFDQLTVLVDEAFRVLAPGGLLIMETPNPENIQVAATDFYRDPTHQRPLPPQLLSFLPEYSGFERVKVLRCSEPEQIHDESQKITLEKVWKCSSPDYAVVAQKKAVPEFMTQFDAVFQPEYGVAPELLFRRFEKRIATIESGLRNVEADVEEVRGNWCWRAARKTVSLWTRTKRFLQRTGKSPCR